MRPVLRHAVDEMERSQMLICGGFARTTDVLGTPTYLARPRSLLADLQCAKLGSGAIFGIFGPPANFGLN